MTTTPAVLQTLKNAKARLEAKVAQIQGYPIYRNDTYAWSLIEQLRTIDECIKEAEKEE